jgi:hypothetical protein
MILIMRSEDADNDAMELDRESEEGSVNWL